MTKEIIDKLCVYALIFFTYYQVTCMCKFRVYRISQISNYVVEPIGVVQLCQSIFALKFSPLLNDSYNWVVN